MPLGGRWHGEAVTDEVVPPLIYPLALYKKGRHMPTLSYDGRNRPFARQLRREMTPKSAISGTTTSVPAQPSSAGKSNSAIISSISTVPDTSSSLKSTAPSIMIRNKRPEMRREPPILTASVYRCFASAITMWTPILRVSVPQ